MIFFDFPQNGLPDRCIPAILADMSASKAYRIAVEVGDNIKSTRDRCSGILRYMAEANPPWDLRFFAGSKTHAPEDWRRNIGVWRPACVVQSVAQWEMFTPPVSRVCGIVALSSGDARRDAVLPPRTVFVGVDDEAIVGEAFSLLRRRGLAHFAYVHTQEQYDLPRSHRRGAILRRLVEVAGCECAECGQSGGEDWPGRLEALAADLQTLPRPCGVVAYNDRCARETMDACHFAGLSIPSQIQIVGVDNQDDICENMRPRLTSVEPDFEGVGHLMAQHIDALLRGGTRPPRLSVCGVRRIAERDSTIDLSGAARLVTAAEKLILAHACRGLDGDSPRGLVPDALAAALHVSRRLLELRFREVRGEGVAEAIRRRRLAEVCRLLRETDIPVGEIAFRCGFPVQTHFNALFRRTYGCSPREWRSSEAQMPLITAIEGNVRWQAR